MKWPGSQIIETALTDGRITKSELARAVGVYPSTVGNWCNGGRPKQELWAAIEVALSLDKGTLSDNPLRSREIEELRQQMTAFEERVMSKLNSKCRRRDDGECSRGEDCDPSPE